MPENAVAELVNRVGGRPSVIVSPFPDLDAPVTAQAWGRRLVLDRLDDPRLVQFIDAYANGPQAPESGMGC